MKAATCKYRDAFAQKHTAVCQPIRKIDDARLWHAISLDARAYVLSKRDAVRMRDGVDSVPGARVLNGKKDSRRNVLNVDEPKASTWPSGAYQPAPTRKSHHSSGVLTVTKERGGPYDGPRQYTTTQMREGNVLCVALCL